MMTIIVIADKKLCNGGLLLQRRTIELRWTLYTAKNNINELCVRHYSILILYMYVCTMYILHIIQAGYFL